MTHPIHRFIDPSVPVGDLIITANTRQRFAIKEAHRRAGVPYPNIMSWDELVSNIWGDATRQSTGIHVLTRLEKRELWESVIEDWNNEQDDDNKVINTDAVAKLASQAFDNSILYRIDIEKSADNIESIETEMMRRWATEVKSRLKTMKAYLPCQQQKAVAKWLIDETFNVPSLTFYGFSYPNNIQKAVFDSLTAKGVANLTTLQHSTMATKSTVKFESREEEIAACAKWIREKMEANPASQIAVVVPKLVMYSADILRIFDNELIPSAMFRPLENNQRPYRISLGTPVTERPLVKTLIQLLYMRPGKQIAFEEFSSLLRNPFIGGFKGEFIRRAKLEAKIRKDSAPLMSWQYVNELINLQLINGEEPDEWCSDFADRWNRYNEHVSLWKKGSQSMADIADFIRTTYSIWGLAERAANSATDTEIEKMLFDETNGWLTELASLNRNNETLASVQQGLHKFHKLLKDVNFQPASGESTITVLSENEASALPFDAVWMLGMTNEDWPKMPSPNPFLSREAQIEQNVPHAHFQQECEYAITMTNAIMHQASEVVFSYPLSDEGRELSPSNVIAELAKSEKSEKEICDPYLAYSQEMQALSEVESVLDQFAPEFDLSQKAMGGTSLLRDQAHCPFKGYVNHRLNVKPLAEQEVGLTAAMRGNVLHGCLDKFWRKVKNHKTLETLAAEGQLTDTISNAVTGALEYFRHRYPAIFTDAIYDLEHDRLLPTIESWMLYQELPRTPFKDVVSEERRVIDIKGLQLTVKVDQTDVTIDEYPDAERMNIFDNKSGTARPSDWFDPDRLMEPQVPLYARIAYESNQAVGSVAFKSFKRGQMGSKGILANKGDVVGMKAVGMEGVKEAVDTWIIQTDELAEEFINGVAAVKPFKPEKSCLHCTNKAICRIAEENEQAA